MNQNFPKGVLTGSQVQDLFQFAKQKSFALPAVNVVGSNSVNAVIETAAELNSPVIIQFSNGGSQFMAGKGLSNENQRSAIAGGISRGQTRPRVGQTIWRNRYITHRPLCKKFIAMDRWFAGCREIFYRQTGKPLYSSHMLDLSEEPLEENIEVCKNYLTRMEKMGMTLEIELGVTGGEEDGVDNTDIDVSKLYTQPEEVAYAYEELSKISPRFTVAAAFGNVHGVYKPGNVKLTPKILKRILKNLYLKNME